MFPQELQATPNWCVWRYETRDGSGKKTKIPYNANTGQHASSTDPSTWATYQQADSVLNKFEQFDGLGFFFAPPFAGVDIDNIEDDIERYKAGDHLDNTVSEFNNALKTYGEVSPSGTGVHFIFKGKIPDGGNRKGNVEMYDNGRFFTMTGNQLSGISEVNEPNTSILASLHARYIGKKQNNNVIELPMVASMVDLTEDEIIARISNSKQRELFSELMQGNWTERYTSQSEADQALANILAFWCGKDFHKMDSIFRESGLMRSKWDAKRGKTTYGESTLMRAINDTKDIYKPSTNEQKQLYDIRINQTHKQEYPARSWTDTGNAQRFIDRYSDYVKYSHDAKEFYVYNGRVWQRDNMGLVWQLIDKMIDTMKYEKLIVDEETDEEKVAKKWQAFIKKTKGTTAKEHIVKELKQYLSFDVNDFDNDKMLLNVSNGYLDLTNGVVHNHDREKLFSKIADTDYTDKMEGAYWYQFLKDIFDNDDELIEFVQRAVGYSLTASAREQKMFILYGNGNNGKSLFINVIAHILGDYSVNMQAESLMQKKFGSNINNDIARLKDARFVTSSEPNEGFVFDEGMVKQMTGDDTITARFLRQENFEFEATFKIWLATNHRPIIRGTDKGIWRRMVVIPFNVEIPAHKVDKDLKSKLLSESPAILDWALEGCLKWQKYGMAFPKAVIKANEDYRNEMDVISAFINECCEVSTNASVNANDLYRNYVSWCDDTGAFDVGKRKFGMEMTKRFDKHKSHGRIKYHGIGIKYSYDIRL